MKHIINDGQITITFTDKEAIHMEKMLKVQQENEFVEAELYASKLTKAIQNRDADLLDEIKNSDRCGMLFYCPYATGILIEELIKTNTYTGRASLLLHIFKDLLPHVKDREFVESFKTIIKEQIESNDDSVHIKELYMKELTNI